MSKQSATTSKTRSYNVQSMFLNVEAEDSSLIKHVDAILAPFALPEPHAGAFVLSLGYTDRGQIDQPLESLDLVWEGLLPTGLPARYYASGDTQEIHLPGRAKVHINTRKRKAKIRVVPGSEMCLDHGCITPVLGEFLSQLDQHILHAASLCLEHDDALRAVLLMGFSSSGKTTTALALAQTGMHLMADDISFVAPGDGESSGRLVVWGLPRPCKVHKKTLAMLPYLSGLPRRASLRKDKDLIDITKISSPYLHTPASPSLILFLNERNMHNHHLEPMDHVTSLTELTRHNLRAGHSSLYSRAAKAFAVLGQLVTQSRSYSLSIGPDLNGLERLIHSLLIA